MNVLANKTIEQPIISDIKDEPECPIYISKDGENNRNIYHIGLRIGETPYKIEKEEIENGDVIKRYYYGPA